MRGREETDLVRVIDTAAALHKVGAAVMGLAPGRERPQHLTDAGEIRYEVYTNSLADLGDDEIMDDAHSFKKKDFAEWPMQ